MRNLTFFAVIILLLFLMVPAKLQAESDNKPVTETSIESDELADVDALLVRLDEIKDMDKSAMSSTEKKEMRKEVRNIKTTLMENSGGVYLSVGALIVIILLLILLL